MPEQLTAGYPLGAVDRDTGLVNVVIETPRRSRCKFKFDEKRGLFLLDKLLPLGASFPYAFGFIPSTVGQDGDPLDVLVLLDEPLFAGCVVPIKLIGVLEGEQSENGKTTRNDRLIGVVQTKLNPPEVLSLDEVGDQRLKEIEHFFVSYNDIEGRHFRFVGRHGQDRAAQLLEQGCRQAAASTRQGQSRTDPTIASRSEPARDTGNHKPAAAGEGPTHGSRSFAMKPRECFRKAVKRIARHQLEKALEELQGLGPSIDDAVHEVRKRLKRVRAVLRLARDDLGTRVYRRENTLFRDAGGVLSEVRNCKVLTAALDKLKQGATEARIAEGLASFERFLNAKLDEARRHLFQTGDALGDVRDSIERGLEQVDRWGLSKRRRAARGGLQRTYQAGRRAFAAAEVIPTDERLHECRKLAKYFDYQLQMLEAFATPDLKAIQNQVHELARVLGDDHDFAILRREAGACVVGGLPGVTEQLLAAIDRQRSDLQRQFFREASSLYRAGSATIRDQIANWPKGIR